MNTLLLGFMGFLLASPLIISYYKSRRRPIAEVSSVKDTSITHPIQVFISVVINSEITKKVSGRESEEIKPQKDWKTFPPSKLVHDVLYWAIFNIPYGKNRKVRPKIKVNFSLCEKAYGRYLFETRTIEIFYRKHEQIEELVDTILHEYVHHLQLIFVKDGQHFEKQESITEPNGDPFESETRDISRKYRRLCIRDLGLR